MKLLAAYIMRGRMQAIVVTAVTAILSLILPPFSFLSGAAVGLVALRVGPRQGLAVAAGSGLAVAILSAVMFGSGWVAGVFAAVLWLPVLALASRLRQTVDLGAVLRLATLFGVAMVLVFHSVTPDPIGWWKETFTTVLHQNGLEVPASAQLAELARLMTWLTAMALVLELIGPLLLARWWQAVLYNPGGFRSEFHRLRLGRPAAFVFGAVVLVAAIPSSGIDVLATELVVVGVTLFAIQGIAVVHGLVGLNGRSAGWLVGMYVSLLLMLPQTALTLAIGGLLDNWFDFRRQFGRQEQG